MMKYMLKLGETMRMTASKWDIKLQILKTQIGLVTPSPFVCFFYGKDTRTNLKTCLSKFKPHMLQKVKFENRPIRVFMYGNYEFLSTMYGLTGANGK